MVCDFKNLLVWKKSLSFVTLLYEITRKFPNFEIYGLTSQIRRAAVSVSCNVAEGCGKSTVSDFLRFLYNANGSIKEVENLLIVAYQLKYIDEPQYEECDRLCREIARMLFGLINTLEKSKKKIKK